MHEKPSVGCELGVKMERVAIQTRVNQCNCSLAVAAAYTACVDGEVSEFAILVLDKGNTGDTIQIYTALSLMPDFEEEHNDNVLLTILNGKVNKVLIHFSPSSE